VHEVGSIAVVAFIESAAGFVVFGAVAFSLVMSILFLSTRGSESAYDRIGAGGISRESEYDAGHTLAGGQGSVSGAASSPQADAERELEIRQMLAARSERRVRRGEPAIDVDAELARLLAGPSPDERSAKHDPDLVAEVRQLVVARNERRVRQGQEPLDVDAEVARTLAELEP
jgi:hypothetical protein